VEDAVLACLISAKDSNSATLISTHDEPTHDPYNPTRRKAASLNKAFNWSGRSGRVLKSQSLAAASEHSR
jgi:hypothetical protein